jgi:excisionase family DNA binding protein
MPTALSIMGPEPAHSRLLAPAQVAALLAVSRSMVYALIRKGDLRAVYVGRLPRIAGADLDAFIATRRAAGGAG